MASKAVRSCAWCLAGSFANAFSARLAMWIVQVMEEFFEGYELAVLDLCSAFADSGQLCLGGLHQRVAAFKILAPGLAQKFGAGTVLLFLDSFHLPGHCRRQRDGQGVGGSHKVFECYLL